NRCASTFEQTCEDLAPSYLDLYLIHWPGDYQRNEQVYKGLEWLYEHGKIKALGVSNFLPHHLDALMSTCTTRPMVNQVETHVEVQNHRLKSYCDSHDIVMEAYAPMMSGHIKRLLDNEVMQEIAKKHNHSVVQIALHWLVDRGIIALPKSTSAAHIKANLDIFGFSLDQEDKDRIRNLNTGRKLFPDPDNVDFGFRD
ncbi:UNVERIFIED_CONTAM: hypothetical protein GTU68_048028, partial [Idotea baltica]|nr:hypothetical protein [Idotea baltica]